MPRSVTFVDVLHFKS